MTKNNSEYMKKYYEEHKQKYKDEYNKKRLCDVCNKMIMSSNYSKHLLTNVHKKKEENMNNITLTHEQLQKLKELLQESP
jgi:TRAP-type uncharacterized transport system substrate-binding protein